MSVLIAALFGLGCAPEPAPVFGARRTLPVDVGPLFRPEGAEVVGVHPAQPLALRLDAGAATLRLGAWEASLRASAPGRGAVRWLPPVAPALDGCDSSESSCAIVRRSEEVEERWTADPRGYEQTWVVARRPGGEGELALTVSVTGARVAELRAEALVLELGGGERLQVGELAAFDADKRPLAARFSTDSEGFRVLVADAGARYPITIDPLFTAGTTYSGAANFNHFGIAVAGLGDVNGDGYADVLIGASGYNSSTGRAYVYHGSASGLSATAATSLDGENAGDQFGAYVAAAGDINGDGYADALITADAYGSTAGKTYVFLGSSSGLSTTAAASYVGEAANAELGSDLDGAGDLNGDGYGDYAIGAWATNGRRGKVYVFYGAASGPPSVASLTLTGSASTCLGRGLGGAGDVNGDGYDDLAVGAFCGNGFLGAAYAYHGSATGLSSTASTTLSGSTGYFGSKVDGVGDINADGYDDVAVSAVNNSSGTGAVDVFFGSSAGLSSRDTILGQSSTEYFGYDVVGLGDIDVDGYGDIVASAYYYSSGRGRAYAFLGEAAGFGTTADETLTTTTSGARFGYSMANAGDLNGDGVDDLIIGEYNYNVAQPGRAYVYLSGQDSDGDGTFDAADCADNDPSIHPGATEVCDSGGVDEDCDGLVNDDDPGVSGQSVWYSDGDGDGVGAGAAVLACDQPSGAVAGDGDCDDANAAAWPGAAEQVGSGADEDCDGLETCYVDADDDGFRPDLGSTVSSADTDCDDPGEALSAEPGGDCDDADPAVSPAAIELCNGADDDCDGQADVGAADARSWYPDGDGDGFTLHSGERVDCAAPSGFAALSAAEDCDDGSSGVYPGAAEQVGDGVDADCDGQERCFADGDGDGWRPDPVTEVVSSDADCSDAGEASSSAGVGDCDDGAAPIHPGAAETDCADPTDYNCDGQVAYADVDGDGWAACRECDDGSAGVYPGAAEIPDDGVDQDCDGADAHEESPDDSGPDDSTPDDSVVESTPDDSAPDDSPDVGQPPDDSGLNQPPKACSCASGAGPTAPSALFALLLLRRRGGARHGGAQRMLSP